MVTELDPELEVCVVELLIVTEDEESLVTDVLELLELVLDPELDDCGVG